MERESPIDNADAPRERGMEDWATTPAGPWRHVFGATVAASTLAWVVIVVAALMAV